LPTPAIGGVGLMKDVTRMASVAFKREGDSVILIGETKGHLGQSIYLREIEGKEEGAAPPVDLAVEKRNGNFVRGLIEQGRVDTAHDLSDGGLLVALAEMGLPNSIGAQIAENSIAFLYGEDQARYLLAVPKTEADGILSDAKSAGVPAVLLGTTGGDKIAVGNASITLAELKRAHEGWFPAYMSAPHTN
jgi:phosphoribosylformylglycinamidine synthase